MALLCQLARRGEPSEPRTDHDNIDNAWRNRHAV